MPRPVPTPLYHFTPIDNLPSIIQHGLLCDGSVTATGVLSVEVGNRGIKRRRRQAVVPIGPNGVVADYVPFYYAPRSPMLSAIHHGRVPEYTGGTDPLIYLVTTVERLVGLGLRLVFTDRNAALRNARHTAFVDDLDMLIDWPLMAARIWTNTPEEPDRRELRMAECLAYRHVPWQAIEYVVTRTRNRTAVAQDTLARFQQDVAVRTKPDWYFS